MHETIALFLRDGERRLVPLLPKLYIQVWYVLIFWNEPIQFIQNANTISVMISHLQAMYLMPRYVEHFFCHARIFIW